MRARLLPPSPPALPGGYDFSRVAWFAAIGATGFSLGPPQPWPDAPAPDFGLRLRAGIETVRTAIATRIRAEVQAFIRAHSAQQGELQAPGPGK